jgi:Fe-S cluster assembly protein SufD
MSPAAAAPELREGVDALAAAARLFAEERASSSPPWLQKLRRDAIARFERNGFPAPRDEDWRYTNLIPLARTPFALAPAEVSLAERTAALEMEARLGTIGFSASGPRLVFVNGRPLRENRVGLAAGVFFDGLKNVLRETPERIERDLLASGPAGSRAQAFTVLNDAFLENGSVVHVGRGIQVAEPLFVVHVSAPVCAPAALAPACMSHMRNLLTFEEGSSATVVEVFLGGDGVSFTNALTSVLLAPNARLTHVKVQLEGLDTFHVGNLAVSHAAGARSTSHVFSFGGKLVRNEIGMTLAGERAGTELFGLFCATSGQGVDNHTVIDHVSPRGDSLELYKGVLDGSGRGAFDGKIVVRPAASRTDARQTNRNLILSDHALVDSKPQLEIYNNDVRCTHGSTTGRLDEDALFYLRSRGLGEAAARALLTYAFGSELVDKIAPEDVRTFLESRLHSWLLAAGETEA